jgi:hypothetical protein
MMGRGLISKSFPILDNKIKKPSVGEETVGLEAASSIPSLDSSKTRPLPNPLQSTENNLVGTREGYRCEFHFALQKCNETGRRFFTTEKGYMGFGPPTLQPGDDVCVIFGGITPFALRKRKWESSPSSENTTYSLVGECCLHGIMRGEAMDELQGDTLKQEIFDVR